MKCMSEPVSRKSRRDTALPRLILAVVLLAVQPSGAATNELKTQLSQEAVELTSTYISSLAEQMRTNHQALQAAGERVQSSRANAAAVRSWSDPSFTLGGMAAGKSMRADEGDFFYGVEQMLPVFGKEKQERQTASANIGVSEMEQEATFQFLRRDLAKALFETAYVARTLQLTREDIGWLQTLELAVEAQYGFGNAMQADVLRVQNELARRQEEVKTQERMLHHAWFTLNRFLNLPLTNTWPQLRLPEIAGAVDYSDRLAGLAVKNEPKLRVMRRQLGVMDEEIALAKVRRRPDLGVGLQGRNYTGTGEFRSGEIMVSLSLPWFNRERYRQDVVREEARKRALEKEVNDAELEVRHEIHDLTVKLDAARRDVLLYQDNIIPRTRQMIESMYAAWQANSGPLRDLLDARRMLLDAELSRAKAITLQHQSLADIILCCGLGDFEALEMIGATSAGTDPTPKN